MTKNEEGDEEFEIEESIFIFILSFYVIYQNTWMKMEWRNLE